MRQEEQSACVSASSALVRATFLVARRAQRGRRAKQATFLVARNLWSQWPDGADDQIDLITARNFEA
jgi:hypothetical protein